MIKQFIKCSIVVLQIFCIGGCNLLPHAIQNQSAEDSYSQYYLHAKGMSRTDLLLEIEKQKLRLTLDELDADLKLMLLHSLPSSPIHNPYSAKAKLNEYGNPIIDSQLLSAKDIAFLTMLRDQLNEQLLILKQLTDTQKQHNYDSRKLLKQSQKIDEVETTNQKLIEKSGKLSKQVNKLKAQIEQLKQIEQSLSQRGN